MSANPPRPSNLPQRRAGTQRDAMPLPPPPPPGEGRGQGTSEGRGQAQPGGRLEGRGEPARPTPPRARQTPARQAPEPLRTMPSEAHRLRRALSSPRALRQAILLQEVLGPPVSLRRRGDGPNDAR